MKTCKKCSNLFEGIYCKVCRKITSDIYYANNKSKKAMRYRERAPELKAKARKFRKEHPEIVLAKKKIWAEANPEKIRAMRQQHYTKNTEKIKTQAREYYQKHVEHVKKAKIVYRKENKYKINALNAMYKAAKLNATPAWANEFIIKEAYELAFLRTKIFEYPWHVDHIVPLRSKKVCGLHVENNLQVIPGIENILKGNRSWPDMSCVN